MRAAAAAADDLKSAAAAMSLPLGAQDSDGHVVGALEGEPHEPIRLTTPSYLDGWLFFEDLQACYAADHETIRRVIVDLDFSALD